MQTAPTSTTPSSASPVPPASEQSDGPPATSARSGATPVGLDGLNNERKRRDLRKMKTVATGFLVGATLIFIATSAWLAHGGPEWLGFIRAAAEAGMVGALADWFAVTALFRRPMGLPIPHTAIIPNKKDMIGDSLGEFIGQNFLSEDVVRDKLHRTDLPRRAGDWLRQLTSRAWGPSLGKVLSGVLGDGAHHKMVDLVCDRTYDWVRGNYELVMRVVGDHAPTWSPKFVDELVADKVFNEVLSFAWAVKVDARHPMRQAVDRFLIEFAGDLQNDPITIERTEKIKQQLIAHPDVQRFIGKAWGTVKAMILEAADDPSSALRRRVAEGLASIGRRLTDDDDFRGKVDGWIEGAAAYVVRHYRHEITTLITDTVERWDAQETSRKIELQVGRDLQFIRINGTVVGALAGLVIYTASVLLF